MKLPHHSINSPERAVFSKTVEEVMYYTSVFTSIFLRAEFVKECFYLTVTYYIHICLFVLGLLGSLFVCFHFSS